MGRQPWDPSDDELRRIFLDAQVAYGNDRDGLRAVFMAGGAQRAIAACEDEARLRDRIAELEGNMRAGPSPVEPAQEEQDELTGIGGFGVDPEDSRQLLELRRAIDDHLGWGDLESEEAADYPGRIREVAAFLKCMPKPKEEPAGVADEDGARRMYEHAETEAEYDAADWEGLSRSNKAWWIRAFRFAHDEGARSRDGEIRRLRSDNIDEREKGYDLQKRIRGLEQELATAKDAIGFYLRGESGLRIVELERERERILDETGAQINALVMARGGAAEQERDEANAAYVESQGSWSEEAARLMNENASLQSAKEAAESKLEELLDTERRYALTLAQLRPYYPEVTMTEEVLPGILEAKEAAEARNAAWEPVVDAALDWVRNGVPLPHDAGAKCERLYRLVAETHALREELRPEGAEGGR